MKKTHVITPLFLPIFVLSSFLASFLSCEFQNSRKQKQSILIVYHGGSPDRKKSPPLKRGQVDALTQATTRDINVEAVASEMRERLIDLHCRVTLRKAVEVREPKELFNYDGIIIGTPNWFGNMAWPVKKIFDEHFIRIWEHRKDRLNDKVLSAFVTAMDPDTSGQLCLQGLMGALGQMSEQTMPGIIIDVQGKKSAVEDTVESFCKRFVDKMKK